MFYQKISCFEKYSKKKSGPPKTNLENRFTSYYKFNYAYFVKILKKFKKKFRTLNPGNYIFIFFEILASSNNCGSNTNIVDTL